MHLESYISLLFLWTKLSATLYSIAELNVISVIFVLSVLYENKVQCLRMIVLIFWDICFSHKQFNTMLKYLVLQVYTGVTVA